MKNIIFLISLILPFAVLAQLVPHSVSSFDDSRQGALGDVDGDGDVDVLLENEGGIYWIENKDGRGKFVDTHFVEFGNGDLYKISDVDNDDDMDILYSRRGKLVWLENKDGLGTDFESHDVATIDLHSNFKFNYLHDLDGDGDLDFISDGIAWMENLGGFQFAEEKVIYQVPEEYGMTRDIVFIDWDHDDDLDLVIHYQIDRANDENQISIIRNLGDGRFADPEILIASLVGDPLAFTEIEDLDKDGDFDIAIHHGPLDIGWFRNEGTSFSDWILIFDYPDFPGDFALVDINRDNNTDVVWCGHLGVFWKANLGRFTFDDEVNWLGPDFPNRATNCVHFGDINGDEAIDLVAMGRAISGFPQSVRWYENRFPKTSETVGVDEVLIDIYPNPVSDFVYIDGEYKFFSLFDSTGKLVARYDKAPLNVSQLRPGSYLLNMHNSNEDFHSRKLVIGR